MFWMAFLAKLITEEFGYTHLSTGDLLRSEVAKGSELGLEAKAAMDAGNLVSDDLVLNLLKNAMSESGSNKFLIDGYPRKLEQAWACHSYHKKQLSLLLFFHTHYQQLMKSC